MKKPPKNLCKMGESQWCFLLRFSENDVMYQLRQDSQHHSNHMGMAYTARTVRILFRMKYDQFECLSLSIYRQTWHNPKLKKSAYKERKLYVEHDYPKQEPVKNTRIFLFARLVWLLVTSRAYKRMQSYRCRGYRYVCSTLLKGARK